MMNECVTVFHGGGRDGVHRSWENFPIQVTYVSFEPEAEAHEEMVKLEEGPQDGVTFVNLNQALNDVEGRTPLHIYSSGDLSSFFEYNPDGAYRYKNINITKIRDAFVDCTTLDKSALELGRNPDFLCLDVQGAALSVLRGGKNVLHNHVLGIRCEVEFLELYRNQPLFGDILTFLHQRGFRLARLERPGPGTSGLSFDSGPFSLTLDDAAPAWADAIFMRDQEWILNLQPDARAQAVLRYTLFAFANDVGPFGLELLYRLSEANLVQELSTKLSLPAQQALKQIALRRLDLLDQSDWQKASPLSHPYLDMRTRLRSSLTSL
tara:strand:- start:191 stop:1156 length:966 start_codon:yes stop_codon:yes gene_type:complete